MKRTQFFIPTSRDSESSTYAKSQEYLYRGGYVRQISVGRYALLPLGWRVYEKFVKIIESEIRAIGASRMELPIMQPVEIWQKTHRDEAFGDLMIVADDHYGRKFIFSATGEALMTELFGSFQPSYKDLPINIYQLMVKFRDETRPRGGLIRVREFLMMDGYNFETNNEDFMKTYNAYWKAYEKIFNRVGLKAVAVKADNGALGGDMSHEFMVITPDYEDGGNAGGDKVIMCDKCGYMANVECAEFERKGVNEDQEMKSMEVVDQPEWVCTMEDNVKHYGLPLDNYLKNVVYKTKDGRIVIAVLRGDQEANPIKISKLLNCGVLNDATDEDLRSIGTESGSVHCWGHDKDRDDVIYVVDEALLVSRNLVGGQKIGKTDTINVNYGRDFKHKYEGDIASATAGDKCKSCKDGHLKEQKGVEVGHIFKYDDYYSTPHQANFIDKDGERKPMLMGAYGIGVGRLMATCVEMNYDEKGIIWPDEVAPFNVELISLGTSKEVLDMAENLYSDLENAGVEVLWDDRPDATPGEKFADADLIGCIYRFVVSEKSLKAGGIEVKKRSEKDSKIMVKDDATKEVISLIKVGSTQQVSQDKISFLV